MDSKQFNRLILMIEAVFIIIALATGERYVVGMICYWALVAVNHLTDFLMGRNETDGR